MSNAARDGGRPGGALFRRGLAPGTQGEAVAGLFMQNWPTTAVTAALRMTAAKWPWRLRPARYPVPLPGLLQRVLAGRVRALPGRVRRCRTPNPDAVQSRSEVQAFPDAARELGAERIATGHYARSPARWPMAAAAWRRPLQDQSYFLHQLGQAQLAATLFPIGDLKKTDRQDRARRRPADPRQEGFHRHLLHRRAGFPRIPRPLPAGQARPDP